VAIERLASRVVLLIINPTVEQLTGSRLHHHILLLMMLVTLVQESFYERHKKSRGLAYSAVMAPILLLHLVHISSGCMWAWSFPPAPAHPATQLCRWLTLVSVVPLLLAFNFIPSILAWQANPVQPIMAAWAVAFLVLAVLVNRRAVLIFHQEIEVRYGGFILQNRRQDLSEPLV